MYQRGCKTNGNNYIRRSSGIVTTGAGYSIINISSPYDSILKVEADAYTFSMSGVDLFMSSRVGIKSLTKTVALQLRENGIRVNAIAPALLPPI